MKKIFLTIAMLVGIISFSQEKDPIYVYEFNKKTDTILDKKTFNIKDTGLLVGIYENKLYFHIIPVDKKLKVNIHTGQELEEIIERADKRRKDYEIYIFMKDENRYYFVNHNFSYQE
ncbi:hypothetical protein [Flavobacterium sp. KJJ]|uniref:hypothetical protein n=1 Tax=Flavobacterium sp. KJJ TaxID=1270193 RepID=UPI00049352E2|nr:hypothetical protein [Flavobacterium sp. KJJ]